MSELDGIVRAAAEVPGVTRACAYGSAGPRAQIACHHSMGTGASIVHPYMFLSHVDALGMWPHVARESPQGGCTYFARSLARE